CDGIVQRPLRLSTFKARGAPLVSSNSTTSSDAAAFGSVNSGKNTCPRSEKTSGVRARGVVAHATTATRRAAPQIVIVFRVSLISPWRRKRNPLIHVTPDPRGRGDAETQSFVSRSSLRLCVSAFPWHESHEIRSRAPQPSRRTCALALAPGAARKNDQAQQQYRNRGHQHRNQANRAS